MKARKKKVSPAVSPADTQLVPPAKSQVNGVFYVVLQSPVGPHRPTMGQLVHGPHPDYESALKFAQKGTQLVGTDNEEEFEDDGDYSSGIYWGDYERNTQFIITQGVALVRQQQVPVIVEAL